MVFYGNIFRTLSMAATSLDTTFCTPNLTMWPNFFASSEQHILLTAALQKLDDMETRKARRRMKEFRTNFPTTKPPLLCDLFLPDEYYRFQEGHYDEVIHFYREMNLTTWPDDEITGLNPILKRLYELCPSKKTQTHLLHLASRGEILPHVDNTSASGSWILGVSLGSERVLKMEGPNGETDRFQIALPSGSVYLQRDSMRFQYKHSILKCELPKESDPRLSQRLSIMIRDLPNPKRGIQQ